MNFPLKTDVNTTTIQLKFLKGTFTRSIIYACPIFQSILTHCRKIYSLALAFYIFCFKMVYFKKLMLKMALLFVLLISIQLATARVPLWISEPNLKAGKYP